MVFCTFTISKTLPFVAVVLNVIDNLVRKNLKCC